jgi:hypothetical protein
MRIPPRSRRWMLSTALVSLAVFVFCATAAAARPTIAGTWKGKYSGPYSGTFTLTWRQSRTRLTGTIKLSNPPGRYPITGSVNGQKIKFGAVGAGATYTGTWVGNSMSGHYKVPGATGSWSATRSK